MADDDYLSVSPYEYTPTGWVCVLFIVLFSLLGCTHIAQAIKGQYWVVLPTLAVGILLEVIGWAGRYWSNQNVLYNPPFLMQIITLIIAPVFFSAWCYTMLGMAIHTLACDFISLIFQAVGGGWAATVDPPTPRTPTNIMVVGIVFQLVSMIIFSYLAYDFILRAMQRRPYPGRHQQDGVEMQSSMPEMGGKEYGSGVEREYGYGQGVRGFRNEELVRGWKFVMIGTGICSLMIIIRGIYRSVELVQGWEGHLITHEVYQDTLDGIPMILALAAVAVFHPTFYLPRRQSWQKA
ncbi:hypothetical protein B9479_001875 [Cryptococcus floricola]|uniref:RTA1 like protein n=1 Tax=Cryptococcus floricola TaxID=2591691 RepID=A0A5D3B4X2_9TREE|nr:hypothetical protein B9479_001875 [Cryptococcus floricola]